MMRVACRMSFLRMRSLERWKIPWIKPLMGLPGGARCRTGKRTVSLAYFVEP